jgi:hypothetical protein
MHCCEWFKNMLSEAGEKGFAVMTVREPGRPAFCLEARPFDADVVRRNMVKDPSTGQSLWPTLLDAEGYEAPYTTSLRVPIRYCPSCGRDLDALAARNPVWFDELFERQRIANPEFLQYDK